MGGRPEHGTYFIAYEVSITSTSGDHKEVRNRYIDEHPLSWLERNWFKGDVTRVVRHRLLFWAEVPPGIPIDFLRED